jgi:hypothetical protein
MTEEYYGDIDVGKHVYVLKNSNDEIIYRSSHKREIRQRAEYLNKNLEHPKETLEALRVMEITGELTVNGYDLIEELKDQINAMPVVQPSEIVQFGNETIGGNTYNPADYEVNPKLKSKKISEW